MKLNELIEQYNKLGEEIEKLKGKEEFKVGEDYWLIDSMGYIDKINWDNDEIDNARLELGNMFHTKEEAEKELKKRKIYNQLKRYAEEHNDKIDWQDENEYKYYAYYNYENKHIEIDCVWSHKEINVIYFSSREIAENAVKEIGEDNIIFLIKE